MKDLLWSIYDANSLESATEAIEKAEQYAKDRVTTALQEFAEKVKNKRVADPTDGFIGNWFGKQIDELIAEYESLTTNTNV